MTPICTAVQGGFSLIELLLVVLIIATLGAIVLPATRDRGAESAEAVARFNARLIQQAIDRYAAEHDDGVLKQGNALDCASAIGNRMSSGPAPTLTIQDLVARRLTRYSTTDGDTCARRDSAYRLGPYLPGDQLPVNPRCNSRQLAIDGYSATANSKGWLLSEGNNLLEPHPDCL